jgi:CDP-diacylglycerol--glycerol-3-phosphate 3-phosphatidyltransferase
VSADRSGLAKGSFVSPAFRERVRGLATPIAVGLGRLGLTPNALTLIGFVGTCVAAVAAGLQLWLLAGVLVLAFGIFDLFDGALARATGRASKFGAFLDSTLDRTGESLVYVGVALGSWAGGLWEGILLAGLAATFASGVTYTRAKAESLGFDGAIGFAPREVRLLLLGIGLIATDVAGGLACQGFGSCFPGVFPSGNGAFPLVLSLGVIALLSAVTVLQRILHVRAQAREG